MVPGNGNKVFLIPNSHIPLLINIGNCQGKQSIGRIFSRDTAMKVILVALDILSGVAIMRDHPMEKLIRDAMSFSHGGGVRTLCLS